MTDIEPRPRSPMTYRRAAVPAPRILGKPAARRTLLRYGGAVTGALGTLALLEGLAVVPERVATVDGVAPRFPDVQFDLAPFMRPAQTLDRVPVSMPPVHTVFLTGRFARNPAKADRARMEAVLRTVELTYPYSPGGVFTHVAYSDNYFARLPRTLVNATMPRTLAGDQPVLKRAVPEPTDVAPGGHVLELRRPEFTVPVRMEGNDVLFTVRGDDTAYVADVVAFLSGSNRLKGRRVHSPRFDAGMTITSTRAVFVGIGLPRYLATREGFAWQSSVNPHSSTWMGFADQQVGTSSPAQDVTFVGGHGTRLSNATRGDYFDNGAVQHLSHALLDLQAFYLDGREPEPFTDDGGPHSLGTGGAFLFNVFRAANNARSIYLRVGGPGFDSMDTTTGRNTPKLQFSGFFPSADFFAASRANLLTEFDLERFITVTRRQNFLIPPRRHRAFPLVELT